MARAALFGLLAASAVGALFAVLVGILDLGIGLLALAAIGGWVVGSATRAGAFPDVIGLPSRSVHAIACLFAGGAWLAGHFGAYLLALLLRPDSSLTFGERLTQSPFLDWLSPQLGLLQVFEVLLLVGVAWYSSRSGVPVAEGSPGT